MNIFKNRPLSLILCIILGGFSLCFIKSNIIFAVFFSLSLLLLVLFIFHKKLKERHVLKVAAIAFLLASLIFRLYFGLCFFVCFFFKFRIHIFSFTAHSHNFLLPVQTHTSLSIHSLNFQAQNQCFC